MNKAKPKAYLEALLADDTKIAYVVFDARDKRARFGGHAAHHRFGAFALPLDRQQVSWAGVSGYLKTAGTYVFVPWAAVAWIGRDWGTEAAVGLSWRPEEIDGAGRVIETNNKGPMSGPFTRGVA